MPSTVNNPLSRDIDFLPTSFYEAHLQRKHSTWRVAVVVAFIALIVFAAIYQQFLRKLGDDQLAKLVPQFEQAKAHTEHLAQLQQALQTAERRADLFAYLRHPWPRSQILAALAEPLPDEIELDVISISREPLPIAEGTNPQGTAKPGETALAKLDSPQRDLLALREHCDRTQIVVNCSGLTDDPASLHRYLEQISHDSLLAKVEIRSMERVTNDLSGRIRFAAKITVRPGYGQPNGPKLPAATVAAANPTANP
ncbi:MAG TPA: hypothetical protein VFE46_11500 [Pirellulales bacterium]|nr:hypothetical protein [Pirellulales bacterium]